MPHSRGAMDGYGVFMRLTCPNCNAQYEVDAAVIPDLGRDVQCSNCGQTWFQAGRLTPQTHAAKPARAEPAPAQEADFDGWDAVPEPEPAPPPAPEIKPRAPLPEFEEYDEEPATAPAPRRPMASDLLSVLREEAQREVEARKSEGTALETQPDLGLPPAAKEAPEREAMMRGLEDLPEPDLPPVSRRDLLPDIEEINSTLRATSERVEGAQDPVAAVAGSGFRASFLSVLALAGLATAAYIAAAPLSQKLPALAPNFEAYSAHVDEARLWLNAKMLKITSDLQATEGQ